MADVKLVWTRLAIQDLGDAHDYIHAHNPEAAAATIDRIEAAVTALIHYPQLGRPGRIEGTRELVVVGTPFVLPYRLAGTRIEILGVLHGARRWPGEP